MSTSVSVPTNTAFEALVARVAALEALQALPPGQSTSGLSSRLFGSEAWWSGNIGITDGNGNLWYAVRRSVVGDLQAGDVLDVRAQLAVRNDTGWNVEFAHALIVGPAATTGVGGWSGAGLSALGGVALEAINGDNITPGQHYGSPFIAEVYRVPAAITNAAVFACVRARCSAANGNQNLTQLTDLQSLTVFRYRGVA